MSVEANGNSNRDSLIFVTVIYAIILFPLTYIFRKLLGKVIKNYSKTCPCSLCKNNTGEKKSNSSSHESKKIYVLIIFLWLIFGFLLYSSITAKSQQNDIFDPFSTLGVSQSSTSSEVKKAYRKLSKIHHPDHGGKEEDFIALKKAYDILTDEISRENWERYGNIDGPTERKFGIALPAWLLNEKTPSSIIAIYYVSALVGIPAILVDTNFGLINILSISPEFDPDKIGRKRELVRNFPLIKKILVTLNMEKEDSRKFPFNTPSSVEARTLLWAYLLRVEIPEQLKNDCFLFNASNESILSTLENVLKLCACISQRMQPNDNILLQLPHIDESAALFYTSKKDFIKLSNKQKEYFISFIVYFRPLFPNLTSEQTDDIKLFLGCLPHLKLYTRTRCENDEEITPNSSFFVDVLIIRDSLQSFASEFEEKKNAADNHEDSKIQEIIKRKVKGKREFRKKNKILSAKKSPETENQLEPELDIDSCPIEFPPPDEKTGLLSKNINKNREKQYIRAHAPYFVAPVEEAWWIYFYENSSKALHYEVIRLDCIQNNYMHSQQLLSPPKPGNYSYTVKVVSEVYLGFVYERAFTIKVVPESPKNVDTHWHISSDEEDVDLSVITDSD